jgi:hypothetical protein
VLTFNREQGVHIQQRTGCHTQRELQERERERERYRERDEEREREREYV